MRSVLFVCTANICRSPTAEGVTRRLLREEGLDPERYEIDSAGTHDYHVGKPPFPDAVAIARNRGYDITRCVARVVRAEDFDHFDHILAMDKGQLRYLKMIAPTRSKEKIELLLDYSDRYRGKDVPDPYGGKPKAYEKALDMIEDGCRGVVGLLAG
jgi:protein-tyrosine phosphatase